MQLKGHVSPRNTSFDIVLACGYVYRPHNRSVWKFKKVRNCSSPAVFQSGTMHVTIDGLAIHITGIKKYF
jgi:hypothetical protein